MYEYVNANKGPALAPLNKVLVENSTYPRHRLKARLVREGLLDHTKCKVCGQSNIWNGQELVMQLDHINGVNNDNRLENLRFICPNCHTQTETFSKRIDRRCKE